MTPSKHLSLLPVMAALLLVLACTGTPIRFGGRLPNFDPDRVDFSRGREISASASGFQLLCIIPIAVNSRHETAYRELLKKAGGDYLTNIRIEEAWTYGLVGTIFTTTITSTAFPHRTD